MEKNYALIMKYAKKIQAIEFLGGKCQKCGEYYHIPCLFVQEAKQKGKEDLCPKCKNHTGKLDKADVYRGIHDDYLKSIGK